MSESVNTIVRDKFFSLFKSLEINITASGRANIIGEHTDYYGGYVLPFAIDKGIHFCASKSQNKDQIFSVDFQEMYQLEDKISTGSWKSYVASCIKEMKSEYEVGNIHLVFGGNIPIGAGLSSSSSLVCGIIEVYNHLFQLNISDIDKVNLASKVEHGAGVQGGKMDQYAIFFGKYKNALLLDCQSLINEPIPFDSSCSFLLINSMVKHNLVHTEYNTRRKEGETALKKINAIFPAAKTARDIDLSILEECKSHLNEIEYCRIMHVIFENERVLQFCKYIREDDLISCGKLLNLSHESLQKLYEVSCEELDTLQQLASETSCIYGSRMMGGGFGGCTINLFESLNEDELEYILQNFNDKFKYRPEHYIVRPHSGITIHE